MSRLALYGRPYVVFDAANKQHRQWFAEFNETRAWGQIPVRFIIIDDHGDLVSQIQQSLIHYYTELEFSLAK